MSEARKGEKNSFFGKTHTEETKRGISEAKETPERTAAREFFFSLPADMTLVDKRKRLRQRFPNKHRDTIHRWCKKFESERLTAHPRETE